MSRQLVLLRHAHADASQPGRSDFERVLSERGRQQMVHVAPAIASAVALQRVVCSAAVRTVETARLLCQAAALGDDDLHTQDSLYEVPARAIWTQLRALDPAFEHVACVLHNPGVSDLTRELIGAPIRGFEPADFAVIDVDCVWSELAPGAGRLREA